MWSSFHRANRINRSDNSHVALDESVQVSPLDNRALFSELADGINAMAGESNALCTVKRQLSCISIQEPVTGLQCRRRFAVTWTGSQLVTLTTSKHVFPDG